MDLMSAAGVDRMITMDLHSPQIQGFTNVPFDNLYSRITLFNKLKEYQLDFNNGVVLAPDVGSAKMSQSYAKKLGIGFALIDKRRPKHNVTEVVNLIGELKNKHVFIIDDMIDTAGTLSNASHALKDKGAKEVIAFITHPVLSGNAIENINSSAIDKLIVSNSIDIGDKSKKCPKIDVFDVSEVLSEAIKRITTGDSISELFR